MDSLRRHLLQGSAAALLPALLGSGLLFPVRALAATWNRNVFGARSVGEALKAYGAATAADSRDIVINAPEIAENGAKVEIEINSHIPHTRSIAVFADRNPLPMCAVLEFTAGALPYTRLQLKLAETTRVRAVIRTADSKNYVASREIKVTLGGCGG